MGREGKWRGVCSCWGEQALREDRGGRSFNRTAGCECPAAAPHLPAQVRWAPALTAPLVCAVVNE